MGKAKILLIDDDKMILATLKHLLAKEGYKVLIAKSGEEALQLLREVEFVCDLIISDLKMPSMNGVEVIHTIRKLLSEQQIPPIPEIIITGYAQEEIYQDALKLKAAVYIDKPFDMKPLLGAIHNLIGRHE